MQNSNVCLNYCVRLYPHIIHKHKRDFWMIYLFFIIYHKERKPNVTYYKTIILNLLKKTKYEFMNYNNHCNALAK